MSFILPERPQKSAFNELLTANLTAKVQVSFPYNINTALVIPSVAGSGTITQSDGMAVLQTGAAGSSSANLSTVGVLKYLPGEGADVRFTSIFTTGIAGSTQFSGIGDTSDGYFFGYSGDTFGVARRSGGVETFTPQSNWSADKGDGNSTLPVIDFTKGNVFQIKYQWLGFGAIQYFIENPANGQFVLVHIDEYANANLEPSSGNPTLPLSLRVENTSNTSNITLKCSSMGGFVEGLDTNIGALNSQDNTVASVGTTEINIITYRVKTTFQGETNRVRVRPQIISAAADGAQPVVIRALFNATIATPSYTDISANTSVVEFDTTGTLTPGTGVLITSFVLGKTDSLVYDLSTLEGRVGPGTTITISAEATGGTSAVTASTTWKELF